jgi:geranylgeranyl diphosphate synthase type 3
MYGIPQTINTANYVYFLAYRELASLRSTPHRFGYDSESSEESDTMAQDTLPRKQRRLLTERDLEMILTGERCINA